MKAGKKRLSCSKRLAVGVLIFDALATIYCLALCTLSILRNYTGGLPYLTALIAFLQAMTGLVLNAYYQKAKAENTCGGITYETTLANIKQKEGATI
ncbi:MAG: hypothetical protein Q4A39_03045 [Eubacteriales bacterium]|nr:hypothetical protein [Eubacteriales bacterium]